MSKGNPRGVYKQKEFDMYVLWKSLPSVIKGAPFTQIQKMGFTEKQIIDLLAIKTQKEFAEVFQIKDPGTLTDWNKKITDENLLFSETQKAYRELTGNVLMAPYKKILKDPKAQDVNSWMKYIENR